MAEETLIVRWEPGPVAVVHAPQDLDMATADAMTRLLDSVLSRQPVVLVVDMTDTRFCDSTKAAVLIRANKKVAGIIIDKTLHAAHHPAAERALS